MLLRKMINFLERKEGIRNDNHFLNTLACSCVGLWRIYFFLSASQLKLHLIWAGRCIIGEASELIFMESVCGLNNNGGFGG